MPRKRPTPGAADPDWRDRRFRPLHLPHPIGVASVLFGPEQWGTEAFHLGGLPPHLDVRLRRVPEGFVVIGVCAACGGRREGLLDGRALLHDGTAVDEALAALTGQMQTTVVPILQDFAPHHAQCPTTPVAYVTPAVVQAFCDAVVRDARWDLSAGRQVHGALHVLLSDESGFVVPIGDLPELGDRNALGLSRTSEGAARHFAVREHVRAAGLDVVAAVVVSEAWASTAPMEGDDGLRAAYERVPFRPSRDPGRTEVLVVSFTTDSFGRVGMAPIQRRGRRVGKGPGELGSFEWHSLGSLAQLLDGVLATPVVVPASMSSPGA